MAVTHEVTADYINGDIFNSNYNWTMTVMLQNDLPY
jgi:hypothetical protein